MDAGCAVRRGRVNSMLRRNTSGQQGMQDSVGEAFALAIEFFTPIDWISRYIRVPALVDQFCY